ncbi:hypothetical protein VNO77_19887 [Canavalia gladiata]|uniref:Uncharacterized protein n=1 Tax=Canavalia gladiata TaxID=3824 RepID=A0AAN9LSE2_CANGL
MILPSYYAQAIRPLHCWPPSFFETAGVRLHLKPGVWDFYANRVPIEVTGPVISPNIQAPSTMSGRNSIFSSQNFVLLIRNPETHTAPKLGQEVRSRIKANLLNGGLNQLLDGQIGLTSGLSSLLPGPGSVLKRLCRVNLWTVWIESLVVWSIRPLSLIHV